MRPGRHSCSSQWRQQRVKALAEVQAVYRDLAARPVARSCRRLTECCQFRLTGRIPHLTKGEALVAAKAVRGTGRRSLPLPVIPGACPLLQKDGRCLIYADRPLGCRTHFCAAAGGNYPRSEVIDLIHRLEAVDENLEGSGPRLLPSFLTEELRHLENGR